MGEQDRLDLLIINGRVIDPLGKMDCKAIVGIKDGKITMVKPEANDDPKDRAIKVIDASGNVVAPGFINIHGHEGVLHEILATAALDGVTTTIGGQCGFSQVFTDTDSPTSDYYAMIPVSDYYAMIEDGGIVANYIAKAGHNSLRTWAGVPDADTPANEAQLQQMCRKLDQEMEAGALGLSFGPGYHPGASFDEMLKLAVAAKKLGGMASIHIRYAIPPLNVDAFKEAVNLAEESDIPLIISHVTGSTYGGTYGDTGQALEIIASGLEKGLRLATDCTLHDATVGPLTIPLLDSAPTEVLLQVVDATINDFRVLNSVIIDGNPYMEALERFSSTEQFSYVRNLAKEGKIPDPCLVGHIFKPQKQWLALCTPFTMVENDAWVIQDKISGDLTAHPRLAGTYSIFFGHFIRERKLMDLMTGIYKCSTAAALFCGFDHKGRIQEGCDADIVVFDSDTIMDNAEYAKERWNIAPDGIEWVIVNGVPVVHQGQLTGAKPGKAIRRTWEVPGVLKGPWNRNS